MQEQEKIVEVKKETWKDPLTNFVYDDAIDIAYFKCMQYEDRCCNLLLGDFTSDGNYSINKSILQELLNVNKFITDNFDGLYYLSAKSKIEVDFELKFTLKIAKENDKKIATLKLVENFTPSTEENKFPLNTIVARYKDDDDVYFLQKVAKVFHIFDKRNSEGKDDENDKILQEILSLRAKMKKFNKNFKDADEFMSKYYVESIIAILKIYPDKFSNFMLKKYAILLENNKGMVGKPNYYRLLRKQFDKLLQENIKMCGNDMILKKISQFKSEYVNSYKAFSEQLSAEPKKAPAKKAAGKSSAKSDAPSKSKGGKKKNTLKKATPTPVKKKPQFVNYGKQEKKEAVVLTAQPTSNKKDINLYDLLNTTILHNVEDTISYDKNLVNLAKGNKIEKKEIKVDLNGLTKNNMEDIFKNPPNENKNTKYQSNDRSFDM